MLKTQVFFIHGGMTFCSRADYLNYLQTREISLADRISWHRDYLAQELGEDFEIIRPAMPLKDNACYEDWRIHFERYIPLLQDNLVLIGNSLGGTFLAKYLSENRFPKQLLSVYLVCPPFDDSLTGEDLTSGFQLPPDLSLMADNCSKITLLFSKNDDVVPVSHAQKYAERLPTAQIKIYDHIAGHFRIKEFPEIIQMIKEDIQG